MSEDIKKDLLKAIQDAHNNGLVITPIEKEKNISISADYDSFSLFIYKGGEHEDLAKEKVKEGRMMIGITPYTDESWRRTNAGKIRAMTDEALAEFMATNVGCDNCRFFATCYFTPRLDEKCMKKWLNWLREEAE